jgi:hypothetical protein
MNRIRHRHTAVQVRYLGNASHVADLVYAVTLAIGQLQTRVVDVEDAARLQRLEKLKTQLLNSTSLLLNYVEGLEDETQK